MSVIIKTLLSALMLTLFVGNAFAADSAQASSRKTVSGVVKDEAGAPCVGVAVMVKDTSLGVMTNADGAFTLQIPDNASMLQFSFLGMQTQEVSIGTKTSFDVVLKSDAVDISDIVVVGYGTLAKKDLSTAVSTVRGDDLKDRSSAFNIMQSLAGKVAGVQNVSFSGKPGGASALRIRGMGSINAGKDPIYVLDGVVGVDPNIISSSNVESIDVLKDAAATAMYGAQGANGVVIITTKGGKRDSGTVTYDMKLGFGMLNRKIDLLNADEFMEVQNRAYAYSGAIAPHLDPNMTADLRLRMDKLFHYAKDENGGDLYDKNGNLIAAPKYDTDWQKALTQTAVTNDHVISFSKGSEKTSVFASVAYQDFQGLVKETYSNRFSGTVNASTRINDWIKVQAIVTAGQQKGNDMEGGFGQGPIRNMLEMPPIVPVHYDDGSWGRKNDFPLGEAGENPLRLLENWKKLWEESFSVFNLIATLNLTKDLQFTAKGDYQVKNRKAMSYAKAGLLDVTENNGGFADIDHANNNRLASENYFTYNKSFFDDKLSSSFVLGASWYYYHAESFSAGSEQYFDDFFDYHNLGAGTTIHKPGSSMEQNTMNSYYFRMNHSFKDRYLFGFSFRADGASNFGANNKYGYFPSASAAWRISEEPFFAPLTKYVNNMKLRVSYGAVGNASIPNYRTISSYNNGTVMIDKNREPYVVLGNLGSADLKWETSTQMNIGLDLGFFNNRLDLIAEYYRKSTKDLLFQKQVPYTTGYSTAWTNLGEIMNEGFELTISSRNIVTKNFQWRTNLVFSTNRLEVVDIGGETIDTGNNTIARAGEEWASYFVLNRLGTWGMNEVAEAARYGKKPGDVKFEDVDHNYVIDDSDRKVMGNGLPKGHITLINTFSYKGLSLMVDINASYGAKILGITNTMMENRQLFGNSTKSVLNAWTPENQNTMIAALRLPSDANFGDNEKDTRMLYNGDFLRISNISLSYDFDARLFNKLRVIKGLSVGAAVENLHVFSNYPGFDPEVGAFSTDTGQGIDFYSYPRPLTISANIKITF